MSLTVNKMKKINNINISASALFIAIVGVISFYGLLLICSSPYVGIFPESTLTLSSDSRLPKWFSIPQGYTREDLTVEIFYYVPPPPFDKYNVKIILKGPAPEHHVITKLIGQGKLHPETERKDRSEYPRYHIISTNGVTEIIEHKQREPIFYVSDDPALSGSFQ
jgi:hypothetical protein